MTADRHSAMRDAAEALVGAGAEIAEVSLPSAGDSFEALSAIVLAEGSWVHGELDLWPRRSAEYGSDVRARLIASESLGQRQYLAARMAVTALQHDFARAFESVDVILGPTSAVGPPLVSDGPGSAGFRTNVMSYTAPQSICNLPACAVPTGTGAGGLPVGVQLTGAPMQDATVLRVAAGLSEALRQS